LSRCEKKLDIFGHDNMFRVAPSKSAIKKSFTNFKRILDGLRNNQKVLDILEKKENKQ